MAAAEKEDYYDIALLIDDLRNDEAECRLNSMKNLSRIAQALGPERTRDELIPYLNESIDDEDEILLMLAEQLGGFVDFVGGASFIPCLLSLLESLSTVEEPTVRDRAIESIRIMAEAMSNEHLVGEFVPMLRNLFSRDWFTSRISACALFAVAYPRLTDATKAEFRGMFGQLCRDDTPMVRRSAAQNLGNFAEVVQQEHVKLELLPLFKLLAQDDQDSVRLLAVKNVISFGKLIVDEEDREVILKLCLALASDRSWRVRWSVANNFFEVSESLGDYASESLIPAYVNLMKDDEAEVRTAAAFKVADVTRELLKYGEEPVLRAFMPELHALAEDNSEHVRASLACMIMDLAPVLGQENTIRYLLPQFLSLLNDESPEVRLNIISKLKVLHDVLAIDRLTERLLPSIAELATDPKWRIRLKIIELIPLLAGQLGHQVFKESLAALCMRWLGDEVFSIRQAATENLETLSSMFGVEWTVETIIPRIHELNASSKYLYRMQALRAVEVLTKSSSLDKGALNKYLVPLVLEMAADPVPNIRFNVAKCFENVHNRLDGSTVNDRVKPCLRKLENDDDDDVKYYAARARTAIESQ